VLQAVNRNQLAFFILANLLTGAINLSIRTIYAPAPVATAVILGYMLLLLGLAVLGRNVSLKFW
jgi:glucosaminylphosphatidylinositol acyltransferase